MKRKPKRALSLVVTSAMLFSTMGMTAAAEPIQRDAQPAITMDTQSGPMSVMAVEENKEEMESEARPETDEGSGEETEEGTEADSKGETDEGSGDRADEGSKEETGEGPQDETEDGSQDGSGQGPQDETEDGSQDGSGQGPQDETEDGSQDGSGQGPQDETEDSSQDGSGQGSQDETDEGPQDETEDGSGESLEDENGEIPEDEPSLDPENPEANLPVDLITGLHGHSWSAGWNYDGAYHWHECDVEGCPVAENSEKDGYAEHNYDDDGVCINCSYHGMDGIAAVSLGDIPTYQEAYEAMAALKEKYPEGMTWTNFEPYGSKGKLGSAYSWKGGPIYGAKSAVGCMAFAFILSDNAFGNLPARAIEKGKFTFEDVKVGDILRVQGNSHSVIVLQKSAGGVTVAEGNYKKTVHWGRAMSASAVEDADFIITRYPEGYAPDDLDDEVAWQGTEGRLNWSVTTGGVLTISGNGAIPDYTSKGSPWKDYDFYTVVIEEGVTGIGDFAFYQSKALSVYIPDSVTAIGQNAFCESALVAVTIPGTVNTIGDSAFKNCENLASVSVSEGVAAIGDSAFLGCRTLAYIDFPASIKSVGSAAFASCDSMVSVRFMPGSSQVALGSGLFRQCWNLTNVTLPQTADTISSEMFQSCSSLPTLYIPGSVQSIGDDPFTSCRALKVIYYGGSQAEWNKIASIYLNASLQSTGTKVVCDAVFDDPFATDPDDPGDFLPGENEPCTNHVDVDNDGKCDNCGEAMSADTPGPDDGDDGDKTDPDGDGDDKADPDNDGDDKADPDDGDDKTDPDDDKKDPDSGSNKPTTDSSSNDSSDSSDSSFDGASRADGSDAPAISATVQQGLDGSGTITETHADGTVVTITTDAAGKIKTEAKLSVLGIQTAEQNGQAVALPTPAVPAVKDASTAPAITVHTGTSQLVKVAIPTILPTAGTVAVIIKEDGTTSVIKNSVPAKNSVVASLPDGATVKIIDNSKGYSDVPAGSWFWDAVSFISARELFYGTAETTFAPGAPMTYAMLTTALARFDGVQTDGGTAWYEKGMEWAAARGIQDGANPDSNITGEQLVTMLWKYQGSPVLVDPLSENEGAGQVSDAQKAMRWAMNNGIISGFEDGSFDPQSQISRAQAAQIIMNFAKKASLNSAQ